MTGGSLYGDMSCSVYALSVNENSAEETDSGRLEKGVDDAK